MELVYDKRPDYFKYQVHLYQLLEKELFIHYKHPLLNHSVKNAIVNLIGEAFCWLTDEKAVGIGVACNIIIQICKIKAFKTSIDIANQILSERVGIDLFPARMNQLKQLIKELIIEYIIFHNLDRQKKITISPQDIFGTDFFCSANCAAFCNNGIICRKLQEKRIINPKNPIFI